jgi:hypothetical protein
MSPTATKALKAIAGLVRPTGDFRFEAAGPGTRLTFALWPHAALGYRTPAEFLASLSAPV